jgi:hypothetical protein
MRQGDVETTAEYMKVKNISLLVAFDLLGNYAFTVQDKAFESRTFGEFLLNVLDDFEDVKNKSSKTVFMMDNVPFHKSQNVKSIFTSTPAYCLYNASYTPQMNPIEYAFGLLKRLIQLKDLEAK